MIQYSKFNIQYSLFLLLAAILLSGPALAMTPETLDTLLQEKVAITVLDIRAARDFQTGHIPGAVNMPAGGLIRQPVPPFGHTVVCGDGIVEGTALAAVDELNRRPGIAAEMLDGGYSRWAAIPRMTTDDRGFIATMTSTISIEALAQVVADNPDLVLVDLRLPQPGKTPAPLSERFHGARIVTNPGTLLNKPENQKDLYVLVDSDNATAQHFAGDMRKAGRRRILILAGGTE